MYSVIMIVNRLDDRFLIELSLILLGYLSCYFIEYSI